MSYLENEFYRRDPKQFMQGYNAGLKSKDSENPYIEGGEWGESWEEGFQAYLAFVVEQEFQASEKERLAKLAFATRTAKQARNKENRKRRADASRSLDRKKAK